MTLAGGKRYAVNQEMVNMSNSLYPSVLMSFKPGGEPAVVQCTQNLLYMIM